MSNRTLIEINHDMVHDLDRQFLVSLRGFLTGGSSRCAEDLERYGVKIIATRHHSEAFRVPENTDGFRS